MMRISQPQPIRPSLKGLHSFAMVAQAGSVAAAARLLGVSASAVSHQVADVEAQLSLKLLERVGGSVTLTKAGRSLSEQLVPAFDQIGEAVRRLKDSRTELKVSMVSTFALNWLIPKLPRFQARFPDVNLFISTTTDAVDLDIDGIDAAVRYGLGDWPSIEKQLLFKQVLIAVAAPSLVGTGVDINRIFELPRIAARHRANDWHRWSEATKIQWPEKFSGTLVETRALAIAAALSGAGTLVVDASLVSRELSDGRLIQLGEISIPSEEGYWIVWSKARSQKPAMRRFKEWLIDEAAQSELG